MKSTSISQYITDTLLPPELISLRQIDKDLDISISSSACFEMTLESGEGLYGIFIILNDADDTLEGDINPLNFVVTINGGHVHSQGEWTRLNLLFPYQTLMNIPRRTVGYIAFHPRFVLTCVHNCTVKLELTEISNAISSVDLKLLLNPVPKIALARSKSMVNLFQHNGGNDGNDGNDDIDNLSIDGVQVHVHDPRIRSQTI